MGKDRQTNRSIPNSLMPATDLEWLDDTTFVTVRVGGANSSVAAGTRSAKSRVFMVHKSILCAASPFFRNALTGNWRESRDKSIPLPNEDPEIFKLYVHWAYYCGICVGRDEKDTRDKALLLCKLWVLGDVLQDTALKDAAIDVMCQLRILPKTECIQYIWENTTTKAQLRRFAIEAFLHTKQVKYEDVRDGFSMPEWEQPSESVQGFLLELVKIQFEIRYWQRTKDIPWKNLGCWFHEHVQKQESCYLTTHKTESARTGFGNGGNDDAASKRSDSEREQPENPECGLPAYVRGLLGHKKMHT